MPVPVSRPQLPFCFRLKRRGLWKFQAGAQIFRQFYRGQPLNRTGQKWVGFNKFFDINLFLFLMFLIFILLFVGVVLSGLVLTYSLDKFYSPDKKKLYFYKNVIHPPPGITREAPPLPPAELNKAQ